MKIGEVKIVHYLLFTLKVIFINGFLVNFYSDSNLSFKERYSAF